MKINSIEDLFEKKLREPLLALEINRKVTATKLFFTLAFMLVLIVVLSFDKNDYKTGFLAFIVILLTTAFICSLTLFILGLKKYRENYKSKVVTLIVNHINPNWKYIPSKKIKQQDYISSKIFRKSADNYFGDDHIEGEIEKTHFEFSELNTSYEVQDGEDTRTKRIFQGIFTVIEFNKNINGETFVLPKKTISFFNRLKGKFNFENEYGEIVKLENIEFDKEYSVYGSNQIEPRYILTPSIIESILYIKSKYNRPIFFSFIGQKVYVAISYDKALFEPKLFKSGVNTSDIEEMSDLFGIIETIIHELNLNTRIWTKD